VADDRGVRESGGRRAALPRKPLCVNRDVELRAVRELSRQSAEAGTPLLLAVSGGSGIGKSTLVITLAYELGTRYPDVLFFAADAADSAAVPDSADLLADLLIQLGMPWQELPAPNLRLAVLRSLTGGRRLLIVLDNVHSAGQVLPLLGDLSKAAVVVAGGRYLEQLRIEGFEPLKLKGFGPDDGAGFVAEIAGSVVADSDPAVLRRLVTLCGGVPRLIAAAAARLADDDEPVGEYVGRLERAATMAEMSEELSIDNVSVVTAVCEAGYEGLTEDEARAYRWLSLLPGTTFDLDAAAGMLALPIPKVKRLVRELVDRSLLHARGDGYFEFPHVVRPHAVDKVHAVDVSPGLRDLRMRAVEWYVKRAVELALSISARPIPAAVAGALFDTADRRYQDDPGVERAFAEYAARWTAFVAAARRSVELGMQSAAATLPMALWPFAYHTFRVAELVDAYRTVLDIADDPGMQWTVLDDVATRWQLARDLGALYERNGELNSASECFARAAAVDYLPGRASVLEWQGIVLEQQGRPDLALASFDAAETALVFLPDPDQRERSAELLCMHRGRNLVTLRRGRELEQGIRNAEAYFRARSADASNAARCRVLLGDIARERGDGAQARRYWEGEPDSLLRYGMRVEAADVHDKLAALAADEGREADIRRHREQARLLRLEL